jgi:hypothetical protein
MLAHLGRVLYWSGLAIAFLCGIAAFTILVAIITNKISAWEAWAVVFFAIVGGLAWLAGRAANTFLLEFDSSPI